MMVVLANIKKPAYRALHTSLALLSAETNTTGTEIILAYEGLINDIIVGSQPLASSFSVLDGVTPIAVSAVKYYSDKVIVTLATPATALSVLTISFADEPNNNIGALSAQAVTNKVV